MRLTPYMLIAALALSLMSGCIPYLEKGAVAYGLCARLVDGQSGRPLDSCSASISINGSEHSVRTDSNGHLQVPPATALYWTWILSGPVYAPTPEVTIVINAEGFETYWRSMNVFEKSATGERIIKTDDNWRILLGDIMLTPASPGP